MKKSILIFVAIVMMAGFSNKVMAQPGVTENTAAGAVIITPISILETTALHFGVMGVNAAGTCVLSTTGVRTQTGGVNLSVQTPAATNAAYSVAGQASTAYVITLPASIVVSNGTAAEDMTINGLLARPASTGANGLIGTLNGSGADTFTIGGTLNVAAAQPAQTYTGSFNVTVAYN